MDALVHWYGDDVLRENIDFPCPSANATVATVEQSLQEECIHRVDIRQILVVATAFADQFHVKIYHFIVQPSQWLPAQRLDVVSRDRQIEFCVELYTEVTTIEPLVHFLHVVVVECGEVVELRFLFVGQIVHRIDVEQFHAIQK